jgi:hypothetical protein
MFGDRRGTRGLILRVWPKKQRAFSMLSNNLNSFFVMAGLVPAIHVFFLAVSRSKTWMPGQARA